jgi:hypothetical protein
MSRGETAVEYANRLARGTATIYFLLLRLELQIRGESSPEGGYC